MKNLKHKESAVLVTVICAVIASITSPSVALAENSKEVSSSNAKRQSSISSEDELAEVVAKLEQPVTRLKALSELTEFASMKLYQVGSVFFSTGDRKIDDLQKQAVEAILKHTDFETVSQALDSNDRTLQFWGVWFWRGGAFKSRDSNPNIWLSLIPKVESLAVNGDANVRLVAVQGLQWHAETKNFLAERLKAETDCFIVLNLLNHTDTVELSKQFTPFLLRFLNYQDTEVRRQALLFIGFNHNSAPMWQINFDKSIVDKVTEMTKSESEEERKAALYALQGMQEKPK